MEQYNLDGEKIVSLFDYLGRPAGSSLGLKVFEEAQRQKITVGYRYVSTSRYKGEIVLYPEKFLKEYFNNNR